MTTVQLHTAQALSPASTVVQALLLALHHVGQALRTAFEDDDRAQAAALSAQVLQHVSAACAAQRMVPVTDALVQALVLEVAFQPLSAQADGTLVDDCFDVWIDHRAWQVEQVSVPALFDQLLTSLRAAGQGVAWTCRTPDAGRVTIQAWAPLGG